MILFHPTKVDFLYKDDSIPTPMWSVFLLFSHVKENIMAADGMSYGNRITHFNTSKAAATVVDALLDSTTYASRMLGLAKPFDKATLKKTVKVTERTQGQWITGAEALNSA